MTRITFIGSTALALLALSAPATAGNERGEMLSRGITECLNAGGTNVTAATEKDTVSICIPKGVVSDYIVGWRQLLAPQAVTGTQKGETSKNRNRYQDSERREMDRLMRSRQ